MAKKVAKTTRNKTMRDEFEEIQSCKSSGPPSGYEKGKRHGGKSLGSWGLNIPIWEAMINQKKKNDKRKSGHEK